MSYYNSVDLHYIDNELDFKTLEEPLKPFFDEYRIHSDVLKETLIYSSATVHGSAPN